MSTILDTIVASKKQEIDHARKHQPDLVLERLLEGFPPTKDFQGALVKQKEVQIIAEIKKASPSAGILREDFDPQAIARIYERYGAAAISVLTDFPFFQGNLSYLGTVRSSVSLPLLRKDFILDRYQLLEARLAGADAVLLIAEILEGPELSRLIKETKNLGLQALVELYDPENLSRVLDSGAQLIGVNNRNLNTFVTRLEHTFEVAHRIPSGCCLVSESGITTRKDIQLLEAAGVQAVLIGETLMRAPHIGRKLDELRGKPGS